MIYLSKIKAPKDKMLVTILTTGSEGLTVDGVYVPNTIHNVKKSNRQAIIHSIADNIKTAGEYKNEDLGVVVKNIFNEGDIVTLNFIPFDLIEVIDDTTNEKLSIGSITPDMILCKINNK